MQTSPASEAQSLSTKKLKKLIKQTRETLSELEQEMAARKLDDQHTEIDHLEKHMHETERSLTNIRNFLKTVFGEKK